MVVTNRFHCNIRLCCFVFWRGYAVLCIVLTKRIACYRTKNTEIHAHNGRFIVFCCGSVQTNYSLIFNTLRPEQNGRHFADVIFKRISMNENVWILIEISLKFVHKGPINNNPALVHIMAWRWPGDKPLSQPILFSLLTHICVTRPEWVLRGNLTGPSKLT